MKSVISVKCDFDASDIKSCNFAVKFSRNQANGLCCHHFAIFRICTHCICIQVTGLRTGEEFESISKILIGNRFHVTLRILFDFCGFFVNEMRSISLLQTKLVRLCLALLFERCFKICTKEAPEFYCICCRGVCWATAAALGAISVLRFISTSSRLSGGKTTSLMTNKCCNLVSRWKDNFSAECFSETQCVLEFHAIIKRCWKNGFCPVKNETD